MTDSGNRVSIPFGTTVADVGDAALRTHSFDLVHFPSYLRRKVAPRVRVGINNDWLDDSDLVGFFEDDHQARNWRYMSLVADEAGCLTDSDDFYRMVHAAFVANAGGSRYIGFARCGTPPDAPLFALAIMYNRYGRGLYKVGEVLPTPCRELTATYAVSLR